MSWLSTIVGNSAWVPLGVILSSMFNTACLTLVLLKAISHKKEK